MAAVSDLRPDVTWAPLAPFWAATARRELRFPRCEQCGRFQWYPRDFCASCRGHEFEWALVAPTGTVYSYTVVRRPFLPGAESTVPFTVMQVTFDEAPGVMLLTNLADEAQAPLVGVGARITLAFSDIEGASGSSTITMPYVRVLDN